MRHERVKNLNLRYLTTSRISGWLQWSGSAVHEMLTHIFIIHRLNPSAVIANPKIIYRRGMVNTEKYSDIYKAK